jgi:predicted anti-sigma-YlaC factor YlaD
MSHLDDSLLNEYLDETLDVAAQQEIESHLATCAGCRARLDQLRHAFAALDAVSDVTPAVDLSPKVAARLALSPRRGSASRWLAPALAAQAVLAVTLLVLLWPRLAPLAADGWTWMMGQGGEWSAEQIAALSGLAAWVNLRVANLMRDGLIWLHLPGAMGEQSVNSWLILLGSALLAWLIGNRLLLKNGSLQISAKGGRHG